MHSHSLGTLDHSSLLCRMKSTPYALRGGDRGISDTPLQWGLCWILPHWDWLHFSCLFLSISHPWCPFPSFLTLSCIVSSPSRSGLACHNGFISYPSSWLVTFSDLSLFLGICPKVFFLPLPYMKSMSLNLGIINDYPQLSSLRMLFIVSS